MLKEFVSLFTKEFPEGIVWKKDNSYFLVKETPHNHPFYTGIFLGKEKKEFNPSLWLLQWLSKRTTKKIIVDRKGEWMFICAKDIFKRSVRKSSRIDQGEKVLVQNIHNECVGYGIFQDRKKISVRNIFDIGDFLRRERQERKPTLRPEDRQHKKEHSRRFSKFKRKK